jgi:hypothetical protein
MEGGSMKTGLFCMFCAVALAACGKTETGGGAASSAAASANRAAEHQADALKINGFYLGMDIRGVPNAMMAMLADRELYDFGFTDVLGSGGAQCVLMYTKTYMQAMEARMQERYGKARGPGLLDEEIRHSCAESKGVMSVHAGMDGRVHRIEFNDVKNLFGAKDLSAAEIAKKLAEEFKLQGLQLAEGQAAWTYTGQDGTLLELASNNVMGIPMVRLHMSQAGQQ